MSDYQKAFESLCMICLFPFFMYSILTMQDKIAELEDRTISLSNRIEYIRYKGNIK